ncbi:response regulator [Paenibacillus sp. P96]|uniref:Response regulator n=1 Tax=Paenibacillus zeirhizosphaerae TaxID=2987519 RepID=A0ABT9FSC1_9BACL|nr:response regulator [Paenibacillus sp. P96]MDP4097638.1 response regulator [Paenibacillus sp. P96]
MKVIVIDDEILAVEFLERQLKQLPNIEIVGKYSDVRMGRAEILHTPVDVIFLDIGLPGMNGIELAKEIKRKRPGVSIVFVTAFNDYAVQAFELEALDYVVKPVSVQRLAKTIERIRNRMRSQPETEVAAVEPSSSSGIRINLFRQVMIEGSSGEYKLLQWRTNKAQELFLYLLQHRGQPVRKSMLIEVLWPEYELDRVYGQLYNTVYHVRQTLRPFLNYLKLATVAEGYILQLHNVLVDVDEWKRMQSSLDAPSGETVRDYLRVIETYTGDYLGEYDYWWLESERERLKTSWLQTAFALASWFEKQGMTGEAENCYLKICDIFPQEERSHFALMQIYAGLQMNNKVMLQYSRLENVMREELGVEPSIPIIEWFESWKKKIRINI